MAPTFDAVDELVFFPEEPEFSLAEQRIISAMRKETINTYLTGHYGSGDAINFDQHMRKIIDSFKIPLHLLITDRGRF